MPRARTPLDMDRYQELANQERSQRQIAKALGMPESTLRENPKRLQQTPATQGPPPVDQGTQQGPQSIDTGGHQRLRLCTKSPTFPQILVQDAILHQKSVQSPARESLA